MLARHDLEQGVALFGRGARVHDRLDRPVAFVQRPGEINRHKEADSVELHLAEMALGDVHAEQTLAPSLSRARIKVAWATIVAAAGLEPFAFEPPIGVRHGVPPTSKQCRYGAGLSLGPAGGQATVLLISQHYRNQCNYQSSGRCRDA